MQYADRDPLDIVGGVIAVVLAVVVGAFAGVVTTFTHRQWVVQAGPVPLPFGLVAGLAVILAVVVGFRLAFSSRAVALGGAAGAVAAIGVLALPGAGGSAIVLSDPLGWTWAIAPAVLSIAAVLWPARRSGSRSARG